MHGLTFTLSTRPSTQPDARIISDSAAPAADPAPPASGHLASCNRPTLATPPEASTLKSPRSAPPRRPKVTASQQTPRLLLYLPLPFAKKAKRAAGLRPRSSGTSASSQAHLWISSLTVHSHVRLQTSNGRYLHAMTDGLRTGLCLRRASLNAAWGVQHVVREGRTYLLLRSASYGRYLVLRTVNAAPAIQRVCEALMRLCDHRERRDIQWEVLILQPVD